MCLLLTSASRTLISNITHAIGSFLGVHAVAVCKTESGANGSTSICDYDDVSIPEVQVEEGRGKEIKQVKKGKDIQKSDRADSKRDR